MFQIETKLISHCIFCQKKIEEWNDYFKLKICNNCYSRTKLKKIRDIEPPLDLFMNCLVRPNDKLIVNALNLYSTLFSKTNSSTMFELFLDNLDDEEVDEIHIKGMILAARAILLFGDDRCSKVEDLDQHKVQALIVLGKCTNLAIFAQVTKKYKEFNGDIKSILSKSQNEINEIYIHILDDITLHDDGTLEDLIIETINLIYNNPKGE